MSLARALVPRQPGLWLAAVALVAAVHAGGIVLALRQVPPEAHEDAGVFIVELAPVAVSLPITQLMLPPGPARMDSIETPAEAASAHPVERQVQPDLPPLPRFADTSSEFAVPERTEKPRVPRSEERRVGKECA